jgi:two-component system chemotaxis response regulator CheB
LVVDGDHISLGEGPRENNARPAIDPMLRSAAVCCGSRTAGVVLTGTLGDGASGLWTIRQSGGITVVQDPKDAAYSEMPLTALNRAKPDHIAQLKDMPALLTSLAHEPAGETKASRAAPTMRWRSHEPDEAIWTRWISLAAARCWPARIAVA